MKFSGFGEFIVAHLILGVTCPVFFKVLALAIVGIPVIPAVVVMQIESFIESAVDGHRD